MKRDLPPKVYKKHGAYYHVHADGKKRVWTRLSSIKDGLPEMYNALSKIKMDNIKTGMFSDLVDSWMIEVMPRHAPKTQIDDVRMCNNLKQAFTEFQASQIRAPDVLEMLQQFSDKPRSYNGYRSMMRELMRFSIEKGLRDDNPVEHIKTLSTPPRTRYITDSELRRIKVFALKPSGQRSRSGDMMVAAIDMAYLTGQRLGDLESLTWTQFTRDGITFETSKTGAKILVEWTPKLKALEQRLLKLKTNDILVFAQQDGQPLRKSSIARYWFNACKKAGVDNAHFHDVRAKAITDKEEREGLEAAQHMGGHTTQQQTSVYVRQFKHRKITATR